MSITQYTISFNYTRQEVFIISHRKWLAQSTGGIQVLSYTIQYITLHYITLHTKWLSQNMGSIQYRTGALLTGVLLYNAGSDFLLEPTISMYAHCNAAEPASTGWHLPNDIPFIPTFIIALYGVMIPETRYQYVVISPLLLWQVGNYASVSS